MLRVAMLSRWHVHATGYANELRSLPDVVITAVWDEDQSRGKQWAEELGVEFVSDLDTLLTREDVDAVCVNAPTNMHPEIMIAAARAGKHIFTEKVMAITTKEAESIAKAVKESGVKFCISFPHRTRPANLFAKKVVDEKLLGDITLMRVRNAHDGASSNWLPQHFYDPVQCGGGAMIDLGAHPMYLCRWILGKPSRITSMFNSFTDKPVEDNAVCVIEFENGAIAVAETSFVSKSSPFSLELYGTKGSLFIGGPENGVKVISDDLTAKISGWVSPFKLPEPLPSPIQQWVNGILRGSEIHFGVEDGVQLTELMEAAYISYREKRMVEFSEIEHLE
ncbi:Gfo/Idh/MocA family oxidoreductase [Caldicoprobacter algeriensis]|uniref:Gfo/Idh/MocA family protein n=1 Tax=Caldicoprobacter algeriensis TaxID=699281 RepID=UPI002079E05D|nr:Gfo/Idh/MocA family oxidoreductase [Caldicoprobacter algeriensis]MCM8900317.1 Gfo/Idh/MocA family oxidoreductase [Caldicoprobacter algeriensis]